jgi:pimeloyl-ACP methyl ester carboxylesterase
VSLAVGVVAVLGLAVAVAITWYFSSVVLGPKHDERNVDTNVEAVQAEQITLARSEEADRPGVYGLEWPGGHAIVGRILHRDEDTVTRRLLQVQGDLDPGVDAGLESNVYAGNPGTRGLAFASVEVQGELGPMPAWVVPSKPSRLGDWAIVVHGINGTPQEGVRLLPVLRRAGLTSMLITYRDDLGAPESPDGLHHLGMTEWKDLEAAARYALDHGARRLVLIGYSMGGSIIARFVERSPLARDAAALILDAPALDWRRILEFNSTRTGFPAVAANPLEWMIGARIDADWDDLDAIEHAGAFRLPILLFHGRDDEVVPIATSDEFAEELPQWVTYYRVPDAGHTQSWNVDPPLYEARVRRFLEKALQTGQKGNEPDRSRARVAE